MPFYPEINAHDFAVKALEITPYGYQDEILSAPSKRFVLCLGRGAGKTFIAGVYALRFCLSHDNVRVVIVAPSLRQSSEMFDNLLNFIDNSGLSVLVKRGGRTRTKLVFVNNSRIDALPSGPTGRTIRGKHVDGVIIDEAIFMKEDIVAGVIFPMVAVRNGFIMMLSTAWDKRHVFFRALNNPDWWSKTLPSAVNPNITAKFLAEQRDLIGEDRFAREYLCQFQDDQNAYFPMSLIRECLADYTITAERGGSGGFDPGGKVSLAAFTVVKRTSDDKVRVIHDFAHKAENYTPTTMEIKAWNDIYPLQDMFVDQTGLGGPIIEHMESLGLPAEGLTMTDKTKEEVFSNLKILMEKRELEIPFDAIGLIHALNSVEFVGTRVGGFQFSKTPGSYDDSAFSLGLACWSLKEGNAPGYSKSVERKA